MNQSGRDEDLFNYVREGEEITDDDTELQQLARKNNVMDY